VQLRGGRGYETAASLAARGERAAPVEQLLRDLRINRIFEGSSEIMRLLIAREAVDVHLNVAGDLVDPKADTSAKAKAAARAGGYYGRWLPTLTVGAGQRPGAYGQFNELATHVRYVERHARKLARATFTGMARWQAKLERKQAFLGRIVDIGAELFAMTAVCVRAKALREGQGGALGTPGADGTAATELADAFCRQARLRVDQLFAQLWENTDTLDDALARRIRAGRYSWQEDGVLDGSGDLPWIMPVTPGPSTRTDVHRSVRKRRTRKTTGGATS
jgi:hypothetical protein